MWPFDRPGTSVLMVCTANICRSPMAEGLLRLELQQRGLHRRVRVESAGTHATQPGRGADPRARKVCAEYGINLGRSRARQVRAQDFNRFHHVLAMDRRNQQWLLDQSPQDLQERISLITSWARGDVPEEIPDPYFGNLAGFDHVMAMLQVSVQGFCDHLSGSHPTPHKQSRG